MGYDEQQANRVREALLDAGCVTEKPMFGGLCFMVDNKLCICIRNADLLCRVGPDEFETAIEKHGAQTMKMGKRTMKGYVYVEADALHNTKEFNYWLGKSLTFNKILTDSEPLKTKQTLNCQNEL